MSKSLNKHFSREDKCSMGMCKDVKFFVFMEIKSEARTLASIGKDREKQEPSHSKMVQLLWKITGQEVKCYHMSVNSTLK